jgi:MFS family permease
LTTYTDAVRSLSSNVRLYLLTAALAGLTISSMGIFGVLLNLYILRLGFGLEFLGMVNGASAFSFAVFGLPAAAVGRRIGTRRAMLAGTMISTLCSGLVAVTVYVAPEMRAEWLIGVRLVRSWGFALFIVNAHPFLMAVTGPAERTHAFSIHTAMWPLAGVGGSLVGGVLPDLCAAALAVDLNSPAPYGWSLFIGSLLFAPAIVALSRTTDPSLEPSTAGETGKKGGPRLMIAVLATIAMIQYLGFSAVQSFFNVYLDEGLEVSTAMIGLLLACAQLAGGVGGLSTPLITKRLGHGAVVIATSVIGALAILPIALFPVWWVAGTSYLLLTGLATMRHAALTVYHQELAPREWRTSMAGAFNMAGGLSYSLSSVAGGLAIASIGFSKMFLAGAAISLVGVGLFTMFMKSPMGAAKPAD